MIVALIIYMTLQLPLFSSSVNFGEPQDKFSMYFKKGPEAYFATLPSNIREDSALLVPDLIQKYGYPCENHTVVTPDGYILEMHRIPHGKKSFPDKRSVIYLQHRILASSADWVLPGPLKGFAYILADFGYDVLMSNVRSTRYSHKHTYLDPERHSLEFWDFT
ncbi:hypothetical protein ILUMI_15234 [Ignelater luminosus]|uniref:Partial AB-hydrolase lipase domain-containing protein n=1 Tax=Ignelater luminosus TaxID=2038154 RepID=A0A8K0GA50_IGNLU|nr:hypothetical protein ILUMI_15234 [Ignelater luminosus]